MATIIALSGWKRSGKDTIGTYLAEHYKFTRLSFAEALRNEAARFFDLPSEYFFNDSLKDKAIEQFLVKDRESPLFQMLAGEFFENGPEKFFSPRTLLILLGTVGRFVKPTFWTDKILSNLDVNKNYVITDLRFLNEISAIKIAANQHNVKFVRINRFTSVNSNNSSERELDSFTFDKTIRNADSLENLYRQVDEFMRDII